MNKYYKNSSKHSDITRKNALFKIALFNNKTSLIKWILPKEPKEINK